MATGTKRIVGGSILGVSTVGQTLSRLTGDEPEFANAAQQGGADIGYVLGLVATVGLLLSGVLAKRRSRSAQPPPPEASSPVPPT
ncbi:MAG: hypothetical protein AAF962_24685 [Actinomycetota bacterium]